MDDINQIRSLVNQAKREERKASNDLYNYQHRAKHEQSQLDTCLSYRAECLNGLKTAKESGLSVVQIRECQLLVKYLDSVVETRQYKADISQEDYAKAEAVWQEKQDSLKNIKQVLQKLETENNDQQMESERMVQNNRSAHNNTYRLYNEK
jgi:flagellar biosynthesis chaperone FliJ